MALLTTQQVVLRIAIIISFIELMIMVVLDNVPHPGVRLPDSVIDVVLLALISSPVIYWLVIRDYVLARDDALAEVTALALTDPLTHLANRRLLSSHLEKVITGSLRHKVQGALLLIDLDGFKRINDEYGHDAGDAVLVAVAERLTTTTRAEDMAARLGGDEFVVLIHRLDSDRQTTRLKAEQVAEKLIELICQPIEHHGQALQVGASVGIRLLEDGFSDQANANVLARVAGAIRDADQAMYQAKETGKGRVVTFTANGPSPEKDLPLKPTPASALLTPDRGVDIAKRHGHNGVAISDQA